MPRYEITAPDGTRWEVSAPDDASQDQVLQYAQTQWSAQPREQGTKNASMGSQAGLFARSALRGVAGMPQIVTEPLRHFVTDPLARAAGATGTSAPLTDEADKLSDWLGLPKPDTPTQRVVSKSVELGMGGLGLAKSTTAGAEFLKRGLLSPGTASQTMARLGNDPVMQVSTSAASGAAGQHAKESGDSPLWQLGSAVVGGVTGAAGVAGVRRAASSIANGVKSLFPQPGQLVQQRVDQRIDIALQSNGIDPKSITPAMRSALREQVGKAMDMGDLNEDAVARLADYTRLNMTPTRGRLTLDPFDVTQEQNASKVAAATGARDARLPAIAQENNGRLLNLVDEMGGAKPLDPYGQGKTVTNAIGGRDAQLKARVDTLYQQARDSAGRSLPMDGATFTRRANEMLDEAMVGGALPPDVANTMNRIAKGEMPFTVDIAEQLKTRIATLQRSTNDGSARMALGVVRQALDEAPLRVAPRVNPGALPAVPGTVPPSPTQVGKEAIDAFSKARAAARGRFAWQESSPAISRALEGAPADTFVQQNILSKAIGFEGVARAAQVINKDPAARDAVRTAIVQYLKTAATGKGAETATSNFSGRGFSAALKDIGDRKLALFFEPAEVETLKAMARTGTYETFQPRGSAVNNSNTSAGMAGLLQGLSKFVRPVASKLPFGEGAVTKPLDNLTVWALQRPAQDIPRGLLAPSQQPPGGMLDPLLLPSLYGAGLLAAPPQLSDR